VSGFGPDGSRVIACVNFSWAIKSWILAHMLVGYTADLAAHRRCSCLAAE